MSIDTYEDLLTRVRAHRAHCPGQVYADDGKETPCPICYPEIGIVDDFGKVRVAWMLRDYAKSGACGPLRAAECEELADSLLKSAGVTPEEKTMAGFKSGAQREHCKKLVKEGKMTQAQFDKYEKETPKEIPDRIHPKKDTSK